MSIVRRMLAPIVAHFSAVAEVERLRVKNRALLDECRDLHVAGQYQDECIMRLVQELDELRAAQGGKA